jgi:alpha-amylase/alpha-mannosidase (GH57 family)
LSVGASPQDVLTSGVRKIAERNCYVVDIVEMGNAGEKCYLFRKIKRYI